MSFLTLEDINTTLFSYGRVYYHKINTEDITNTDNDYTDVKLDFVKVTRIKREDSFYKFIFEVNNSNWTGGYYFTYTNGDYYPLAPGYTKGKISFNVIIPNICLVLLLIPDTDFYFDRIWHRLDTYEYFFDYSYYNPNSDKHIQGINIPVYNLNTGEQYDTITELSDWGLNAVPVDNGNDIAYLYAILVKSDFKFECNQELINGKINTVQLGTDTDYLPDGDLIGEYTPSIRVLYNDETIPVTYDNTLNDYTFDLDLTEETTEHKIHLKVLIDSNEVLNSTSTDVTLQSSFETINTLPKLEHLFSVGGVGRLGSDLTLTDDLTLTKDVYLIGNEHTINMDSHKIIVPSDKIFKAEQTTFTNGENTIQQNEASKVELINCTFTDCTGLGSVIDCQIDVTSLDNPTDFTTTLNKCTLNNNDMCILHGGNLTVTDCTINGKISDDKYPYFLYQTDGEAHISGTVFNLTHNTPITADIGYNSCIFTVGEQATINYGDHTEYSQNNVTGFLENSRNISIINVTYYYPPIEDYVTLQSTKGYCHSVSSVDFVFKTNVQLTRGD